MLAQTLKGFRDFLGEDLLLRKKVFQIFEDTFKKYGYEPLETPALEYAEVLLGKYGEDEKLVYKFKDHGEREVAMRYDLTVPTARVFAQHRSNLKLPWKRYQIQPVWRADNTQKGRFREFYQLDADTFGSDSMTLEAEYLLLGIELFKKLGFESFRARINNRKLLNAIAEYAGHSDKFEQMVNVIDKWEKRSEAESVADLTSKFNGDDNATARVLECIKLDGSNQDKLSKLSEILKGITDADQGLAELKQIFVLIGETDKVVFDLTIARGLSYYTGPVWEWQIIDGNIGSVGGAGRYDKLVGSLLGEDVPACGCSFGIERIIEVIRERGMMNELMPSANRVMVTCFNEQTIKTNFELANKLRLEGFETTFYPEPKKLGKQLDYADEMRYGWVIVQGEDEIKENCLAVKNMFKKEQRKLNYQEAVEWISEGAI